MVEKEKVEGNALKYRIARDTNKICRPRPILFISFLFFRKYKG